MFLKIMKEKNPIKKKRRLATLRARRVRARITGTAVAPRLSVKKSLKHIYAQLIDDVSGQTLAAASDLDLKEKMGNLEAAKEIGGLLADRAKEKNITVVVFDRGGCRYHGRIAALAEGARAGGLQF